jgi:signal transduction histidine kinase
MDTLNVIHLEDSETDALLVRKSLERGGLKCNIRVVTTLDEYSKALHDTPVDAVLADNGIPGLSPLKVLELARSQRQEIPLIYVSGAMDESVALKVLEAGATGFVPKTQLDRLTTMLRSSVMPMHHEEEMPLALGEAALQMLLTATRDLSLARSLHEIIYIVKRAARRLTGADGAAIILREGTQVFYADEDAIRPLWKGRHFSLNDDIAGWTMLNKTPTIITDVARDDRISLDIYRPTFVKSLLMVPVDRDNPVAALANYWSAEREHKPSAEEQRLLQMLADSTAVAIESVRQGVERNCLLADTTLQLQQLNTELENLTTAVVRDLHVPLHGLRSLCALVEEEQGGRMNADLRRYFDRIKESTDGLMRHIEHLMELAKIARVELSIQEVNLSALAQASLKELQLTEPNRPIQFDLEKGLKVQGDITLLRLALGHMIQNAWKFTSRKDKARIEFKSLPSQAKGQRHFIVRDNGVGFAAEDAGQLFTPFFRLHADYPGVGLGLAVVRRIMARHGGTVWMEGLPELGAAIHFTLPDQPLQVPPGERAQPG